MDTPPGPPPHRLGLVIRAFLSAQEGALFSTRQWIQAIPDASFFAPLPLFPVVWWQGRFSAILKSGTISYLFHVSGLCP